MSLKAILRSVISENNSEDIIEEYVIELHDKTLPNPHLGGIAGLRVVNRTDMSSDYRIKDTDWRYEAQEDFDVSDGKGRPKYAKQLNRLDKIASEKYQAESPGETFNEMRDYFVLVDAPFQVEGVHYSIDTPAKAEKFSLDLLRKFGTDKQLEFEAALSSILAQNERPNVFHGEVYPTKQKPSLKAELSHPNWAMFS